MSVGLSSSSSSELNKKGAAVNNPAIFKPDKLSKFRALSPPLVKSVDQNPPGLVNSGNPPVAFIPIPGA